MLHIKIEKRKSFVGILKSHIGLTYAIYNVCLHITGVYIIIGDPIIPLKKEEKN